jgi:hypothetical protein
VDNFQVRAVRKGVVKINATAGCSVNGRSKSVVLMEDGGRNKAAAKWLTGFVVLPNFDNRLALGAAAYRGRTSRTSRTALLFLVKGWRIQCECECEYEWSF